ncbi:MAG: hypothetical protein RBT69_00445 [Spirochaetia bacterium]|jgi:hypothetical protein|nr:hypothetical protein [Spirochaetia bacterium]
MRKIIIISFILLFVAGGLFAVEVTATAPTISGFGGYDFSFVQDELDANLIPLAVDAVDQFDKMNDLARGFSNANSYAADAATTRGLMGYKFLSIAVGTMAGVQMPSNSVDALNDTVANIENEGDIYFGAGFQALTVSVGINAGFLMDGLYLTGKIGKFSTETDEINYDSFVFGLLANYQLVDPFSLGIIKWRGLQVGSGIIYYKTVAEMTLEVEPVSEAVDPDAGGPQPSINLYLDPTIVAEITSSGFKIPVDLITGIRLFWIANLSFGLGFDMNFAGNSEIALKADGTTYFDEADIAAIPGATQTPGSVKVKGGTKGDGADFFRLRAMAGIGFGLGPLKLDIPFTYYFDGTGLGTNIGITGALTL